MGRVCVCVCVCVCSKGQWSQTYEQTRTPAQQRGARVRACTGGGVQARPMRTSSVLSSCMVRAVCESALGMAIIE